MKRLVVFHQRKRFLSRDGWWVKPEGSHWRARWRGPFATMEEAIAVASLMADEAEIVVEV